MRAIAIITPGGERYLFTNLSDERFDLLAELVEQAGWDYEQDPEDA